MMSGGSSKFLIIAMNALFYVTILISGANGFYAPMRKIHLRRVVSEDLPHGTLLTRIPILLNSSRPAPEHMDFSLTGHKNLSINGKGELSVNGSLRIGPDIKYYGVTVTAKIPTIPASATVQVTLEIVTQANFTCTPSETCFAGWIDFQVHEDAKGLEDQVPLGHLGPPISHCKQSTTYSLEAGEERVWLSRDFLWVRTAELKSDFNVTVKCSVGERAASRDFQIHVLPRTPWETMSKKTVRLFSTPVVEKGGNFVASWGFFKEGARADLVQTNNTSIYKLTITDGIPMSSIITNRTLFLIHLEWNTTNLSFPLTVEAKLQVTEPGFPKEEVQLVSTLQLSNSSLANTTLTNMTYARHIEVSPGLLRYARVSYPTGIRELAARTNITFKSVLPWDLMSPFDVTRKAGIVYLSDKWLAFHRYYLNFTGVLIEWRTKKQLLQISWIPVEVKKFNNTCHEDHFLEEQHSPDDFLCSSFLSKKECVSTCGLAVSSDSGGLCSWIPQSKTRNYTTCSTDRVFCPDRFCDPLEQLAPHICPQDCTKKVHTGSLDGDGEGIGTARGHCTCSLLETCACGGIPQPEPRGNKTAKFTRQDPRKDELLAKPSCDGTCLVVLLVVGTTVTLLLLLVSAFFCKKSRSRRRKMKKLEDRLHRLEDLLRELEAENPIGVDRSTTVSPTALQMELNNGSRKNLSRTNLLDESKDKPRAAKIYCKILNQPPTANRTDSKFTKLEDNSPKFNVRYERYKFNAAKQGRTEPSQVYVARLKTLAKGCQYGPMTKEFLLDKIIQSIKDPNIRERMFNRRDITIEEAAKMLEASARSSFDNQEMI